MIILLSLLSCKQAQIDNAVDDSREVRNKVAEERARGHHSYGGWYCPDNVGGFPPVDIQALSKVPVVIGRMPTEEETRNGRSLMYFDPTIHLDARPLDITLPQVARIYSKQRNRNELIIVIQAVVVGTDTIMGYRYPEGGNGSAWYDQIHLLSDNEVDALGPAPFVHLNKKLISSKADIWKAICTTAYAQELSDRFSKAELFQSEWNENIDEFLDFASNEYRAQGFINSYWGNLYIQIDYDYNGIHRYEKILVTEDSSDNTIELNIVSGPHPDDIKDQYMYWSNWMDEVIELCKN
jgi:hypothetical protein